MCILQKVSRTSTVHVLCIQLLWWSLDGPTRHTRIEQPLLRHVFYNRRTGGSNGGVAGVATPPLIFQKNIGHPRGRCDRFTGVAVMIYLHRCQPSRNRAGNPAFWLYFEITKIAENSNNFSCTETFCSKKLLENVSDSIT